MLAVHGLTVRYGNVTALDDFGITVSRDEVVAVLGPSGSGKSTLLRVVAGLHPPDTGAVSWEGNDITAKPAHLREFGLVFQDYALFPHLDVAENVGFGLRMQDVPADRRSALVHEALEQVGLSGLGERRVSELSGGQAQRVALARALAPSPRLLLLDEPLGALDRALREQLTAELAVSIREAGVPALYVTHDQHEAFGVADRVAVLDDGRLVQEGRPEELWQRPRSELVARLVGLRTIVAVEVLGGRAHTPLGDIPVAAQDGSHRLVLRPEAFRPDPGGAVEAEVRSSTYRGGNHLVVAEAAGSTIELAMVDPPPPGTRLRLTIDPSGVSVLSD